LLKYYSEYLLIKEGSMAFSKGQENYQNEEVSRTLLTITGDSAVVEGKFKISKSIEIDCEVKGQLDVEGQVIIQRNGFVSADVKIIDAEVIGRYEGNMEASGNVEIKETGIVNGNIKTNSLIINKGGIFSGNVSRISDSGEVSKKKVKSGESNLSL
jgi:cytoskeletal protein CcmA (bactofilin family)